MDQNRAVSVLAEEASTVTALLTADALAAPVPTCPGWAVADLARHLGGVHRWARHAVLYGPDADFQGPAEDAQVRPWFSDGANALIETLAKTSSGRVCWTFDGPGTAMFWMRRQAHETALHRWDLQDSLGVPSAVADDVALDGIDEVATMFLPRQLRLGRLASGPEVVEIVPDQGPRVRLSATAEPSSAPSCASVHGPAEVLLLLLWKRTTLDDPRLSVSGSRTRAGRLLAKPLTP
jgi:uncharacterized protein (TIGR03083 family)